VSAIAHWIEQHGISTVVIGLIRLHLEKMSPPRALWVPFELGRPLGAPSDHSLQQRVLTQALTLIESATTAGQIVDFDEEDSRAQDDPQWRAPQTGKHDSIRDECSSLESAYTHYTASSGRTAVGVAGIPVERCAEIIDHVIENRTAAKSPREEISDTLMFRLAIDDVKAFYIEAALNVSADDVSQLPGSPKGSGPSSRQIGDWFWLATSAGTKLRQLREELIQSDNVKLEGLARRFVIPHRWRISA